MLIAVLQLSCWYLLYLSFPRLLELELGLAGLVSSWIWLDLAIGFGILLRILVLLLFIFFFFLAIIWSYLFS